MVKQRYGKLTSVSTFLVLAVLMITLLSMVACSNGSTTQNTTTTPPLTGPNHLKNSYSAPNWWKPCVPSKVITVLIDGKKRQVCTAWDESQPAAQCDSINYQKYAGTAAVPLTSWRGFDVCGPRPYYVYTADHYTEFSSGGSVEQEFECTELVKRYLLLAFGLPSLGGTNGDKVVDNYTDTKLVPNTQFHKIINDTANNGQFHMFPVEGDVLSYSTVHTSIVTSVTDMNSKGEGSATINVIEQNKSSIGTAKLTMTNWIIDNSVSSWMTTRQITIPGQTPVPSKTSVVSPTIPVPVPTPTPFPSPTATPTSTPTPTPTPTPSPTPSPTPTQPPTPTPSSVFTGGTWQGQGTYYNGQSPFVMILKVTVNGNTFSGTLEEPTYSSEVAVSGSITISGNTVTITFTDYASVYGGQIQLNCTYTATVSNGQMNGFWYYPGDTSPDGTISLSQTG